MPRVSNNPGGKGKDWSVEFAALSGASGIQVIRDDLAATVLRFEFEPGQVEWVVFNPDGQSLQVGSVETNEVIGYRKGVSQGSGL